MDQAQKKARKELRGDFERGQLSLFLGAGVSAANHLPTWEGLVLAMYFNAVSKEEIVSDDGRRMRPFPNYLHAISEWQLRQRTEPLEITARKLRRYFEDIARDEKLGKGAGQRLFYENLHRTLYASLLDTEGNMLGNVSGASLRMENRTLDAVAGLCEASPDPSEGVQSVITYNYDDLLEMVLENGGLVSPQPVDGASIKLDRERLPVYHVHGQVPLARGNARDAPAPDLVFTEDQYHLAARDAYAWSALVQLQAMSSNTGLLIGLSVTDRSMRRLLDAVSRAPLPGRAFALLKRPENKDPDSDELRKIHERAIEKLEEFEDAGMKAGIKRETRTEEIGSWVKSSRPVQKSGRTRLPFGARKTALRYEEEICMILQGVQQIDHRQEHAALEELRVTPVWFDSFDEIAAFVKSVGEPVG